MILVSSLWFVLLLFERFMEKPKVESFVIGPSLALHRQVMFDSRKDTLRKILKLPRTDAGSQHGVCGKPKGNVDDETPSSSFALLDSILSPSNNSDPVAWIIPLLGLGYGVLVDDFIAAATTILLFSLLRTAAIQLVVFPELPSNEDASLRQPEDMNEEEGVRLRNERLRIDAFCIGISAATVLIVGEELYPILIGATIAVGVALRTIVKDIVEEEQLTKDDKLMNQWDKVFEKQSDRNNDSNISK